ncbi:MAG TPA: DUF2914 domain-containing protein [Rhizomicrobium sp.]
MTLRTMGDAVSAWKAPFLRYERHLSAAAMVAGFAVDNFAFGRVDHPGAHIVFIGYLAVAVLSIALGHAVRARRDREQAKLAALREKENARATSDETPLPPKRSRLGLWMRAATQFALGGLWSGFLVFYSRSAVLAASWPFLLLLLCFLIGNEAFRHYHSRLVFASLLLFFALYSYAVFVVPVFTKTLGLVTFVASGVLACGAFFLFLHLLRKIDRARYAQSRWKLIGGALAIVVAMNAFYFTGILPPLPLALSDVGIYHEIHREGAVYQAQGENEPLAARLGLARPVIHVVPGEKLALYSAVFAPIKMTTRISHRWQWWNARAGSWQTQSIVSFQIAGGRDRGYRAYSLKSDPRAGDWRVDIDSADGRLIGRLGFAVVPVVSQPAMVAKTLS